MSQNQDKDSSGLTDLPQPVGHMGGLPAQGATGSPPEQPELHS